jgi:TP901 family phage tail tape measure protein
MAQDNFINAQGLVDKLTAAFYEHEKALSSSAQKLAILNKEYGKLPSDYSKSLETIRKKQDEINASSTKLAKTEKQIQNARLAELRLAKQREQAFDKYEKQLEREQKAKARAAEKLKQENREYVKLNKALGNVRNEAKDVAAAMFRLEREGKKTTAEYKRLEAESRKLARQTNILDKGIKDIDKSLGLHQRNVGNYGIATENLHPILGRVNSQLMMMGTSLDELTSGGGFKGLLTQLKTFGSAAITFVLSPIGLVITALGALYMLIRSNKQTVLDFDNGLKNVGKTTGMADEELSDFGDKIIELSRDLKTVGTPVLLEYATVAGQLGVKGTKDLLAFAEALAKLETASNIRGEEGATNVARLLTLTDGGVQNVADFADEIVNLGNNFAATENEILGNATAIAQNTGQYKFGRQQVLAYATATKALGIEAELTGSTLGRTLGEMEKAIRTGQGIEDIARLTGLSIEQLKSQFREDAAGVFTRLVEGLNRTAESGQSVNEQLELIGITGIRDQRVIASLATSGFDVLRGSLDEVGESAGAASAEFEAANKKMTNQIKTFGVAWDNLILTIEDGEGVFSKFFGWLSSVGARYLENITKAIDGLGDAMDNNRTIGEKFVITTDSLFRTIKAAAPFLSKIHHPFRDRAEALRQDTQAAEANIDALREQYSVVGRLKTAVTALTEEMTKATDANKNWTEYLYTDSGSEKTRRTLTVIGEEISALNEEIQGLNTTDIEGIRLRQKKIKQLEEERDRILGVKKETKEYRKETEKVISVLKEWLDLQKEKERINDTIDKRLKDNAKKELKNTKANTEELEKQNEKLQKQAAEREKNARQIEAEARAIKGAFIDLGAVLGISGDTISDLFDSIRFGFADAGEAAEQFGALFTELIMAQAAAQNRRIDREISDLEKQKEYELSMAGDNAAAREAIESRYAYQIAKLREEQARNEKEAAIISAVINTATAVVKTFAELGFPAGAVAAGIVAALGAAQIAIIASQPIPQFETGVRNFEGGTAIINEKRQEIVGTPDGKFYRPQGKNLMVNLPKGSDVYKSEADFQRELNGMLGVNGIQPVSVSGGQSLSALDMEMAMRNAIGDKPQFIIDFNESGVKKWMVKGMTKTNIRNNRVNFKGGKV